MTLTPEQFNQLTTKAEHEELKKDVEEIKKNVRKILTAVDGIAKKFGNHEIEHISNQAAHDKFEEKFVKIENRIETVEIKT